MQRNKKMMAGAVSLALVAGVSSHFATTAQAPPPVYSNFESSQTNPIRLSPDGKHLLAVNTANNTLSVFDVTQPGSPRLLKEIPVGIEPVSVNATADDTAWVVSQVSNSISVVSISKGIVLDTINLKFLSTPKLPLTEPMDVVFAGGQAYVSVSRPNVIAVFGAAPPFSLVATIPVYGDSPRAMAVSPDGSTVYAAFALSGNASTIIPRGFAPPQSAPTNPALPPPPQVGLVVSASDPHWKSYVTFTMPDNDVVAIKAGASPTIAGYYSGLGTINLGLGVNPATGDLFVANTDALNTTHFETNLCGHFVNNRITRVQVASGTVQAFDLNPTAANACAQNLSDLSTALAQPTNVVFDPGGEFMYVAAFGTDRVAKVDTNGNVLSFVDVALPSGQGSNIDPANKRGPRGLALNGTQTLYALNRISNTISIIDTVHNSVSSEIVVGNDPTPTLVKQGRGFLYDAKLSGSGNGSCAGCHIDGDMDHIAWDLGNPGGDMTTILQNGITILEHPMKGPMNTQTLHGLNNLSPYHWRGDKANFAAFNAAFSGLMGGTEISDSDMANFTAFINTVAFVPNPNQTLERGLPATIAGGNPKAGQTIFRTVAKTGGKNTCTHCHQDDPGPGSNRLINLNFPQPTKTPELRNDYQKLLYTKDAGTSIDGFGLNHDGNAYGFLTFFHGGAFKQYTLQQKTDMAAYITCFESGTAPTVGYTRTLLSNSVQDKPQQADWTTLESQALAGNIDLIARGTVKGKVHGLLYQPSVPNYLSDTGAVYTRAQLQTDILAGDILTFMGVVQGTGSATAARSPR